MKNRLLLLSALMIAAPVFAIDEGQEMTTGVHGNGSNIFPHFNTGSSVSAPVYSRLIAKTVLFYNGSKFMPIDSVEYRFNAGSGRGGYTTPDAPNVDEKVYFDESFTHKWDKIGGGYILSMHRVQKYNAENQVTELTYKNWRETSSTWKDSAKYIYTYQNGLMNSSALQLYIGGWNPHGMPSAMYYSGNRMTAYIADHYKIQYIYNASNQLVESVDQGVVSATGLWEYEEKHSYTYAGNKLKTHMTELYDVQSGQWVKATLLEYEHDANNDIATLTEKIWNGSSFVNSKKNEFTYDASHNKMTDISSEWDGSSFQNKMKETWEYNNSNQVTQITTETWAGNNWAFTATDQQFRFYYQVYFPTTVNNLSATGVAMQLYPVPAATQVTVSINADKSQSFNFSIVDMKGSVIRSWDDQVSGSYQKTIAVAELPAGAYFLKAAGRDAVHTERFTVVR